jgi:hypothetical protein
MKGFELLTEEEQERLLKYPAYIALMAVNKDARIDEDEKTKAEKFLHIKTYSASPLFAEFYAKADREFEKTIGELDNALPKERSARELAIRNELAGLEEILKKLDPEYARLLHESMRSFKEHVSKAHFNVLEYFVFPLPIKGLTE